MSARVNGSKLAELYRLHAHHVLRRARQILGNEEDARETLQEVFTALAHSPESLDRAASIPAWLYGATTHHALNTLRQRNNRARLVEENVRPLLALEAEPCAELVTSIRQLLSRMPEQLSTVAVYYHLDGMTHAEIAEVMGCSRRHVGNLLERLAD